MRRAALLVALLALCAVLGAHCQEDTSYDYTYDYNYNDSDVDLEQTYEDDSYGYYADDDNAYYEYYGYYADDFDGQEGDYYDYYDEEAANDWFTNCETDAAGKFSLHNGTASCDVRISGADKTADQLQGGIDGVYAIAACHNGKPLYRRKDSTEGQVCCCFLRALAFASTVLCYATGITWYNSGSFARSCCASNIIKSQYCVRGAHL